MPDITKTFLLTLIILIGWRSPSQAQEFIEDVTKLFEIRFQKPRDSGYHYPTKLVLAPVISYEPSTSLGIGVGTKLLFKFNGSDSADRTSNVPMTAQYTLLNQFFFLSEYNIFTKREAYLIKGEVNYLQYPISFFGTGTSTLPDQSVLLNYRQFLWEPIMLRNVWKDLFVGGGLRYNAFSDVEIIENAAGEEINERLDSLNFRSVGLEFAFTYDSRNSLINASKGYLIEFTHGFYEEWMGSTQNFTISRIDLRKYWTLPNDDALAGQIFTRMSSRQTPTLEQSALGGSTLLRGFPERRFIDQYAFFGQMEYRWKPLKRLGMVFFAAAGDVGNGERTWSLETLKYSLGTGLRLTIVPSEELNIRLDYGLGIHDEIEQGFYLGIAEAF